MDESRTWKQSEIDALIGAKVKERTWSKNDVMTVINTVATFVLSLATLYFGREVVYTGSVAQDVKDRQIVHEQKTQDVKVALEAEKASVDRKLERIEKQTAAVESKIQVIKP